MLLQTFSLNKAGLNTNFPSRVSLLALANPKFSKFNPYISLQENIGMTKALESRFDLLFTLTDKASRKKVVYYKWEKYILYQIITNARIMT